MLVRVGSGGLKGSTMGLARPYRPFDGFGKVVADRLTKAVRIGSNAKDYLERVQADDEELIKQISEFLYRPSLKKETGSTGTTQVASGS